MTEPSGGLTFHVMKLIAAVLAVILSSLPALAQQRSEPVPATRAGETQRLDRLFERLKSAPTPEVAKSFASQIEQRFEKSGSDTADLVLQRAKQAIESKNLDTALDLIDFAVTLKPDWAEAYHRRAIIHFILKDEESAMRDIRLALGYEPRHFHALAGLGRLLQMMGKKKNAYQVYQRTLDVHPHFPDIAGLIERLKKETEGQPI
ncbi:MAG: tetratricopeptide repeat protein [Rhabdaerophilum sp.]